MTSRVGPGNSAPNEEKTRWNEGMTKIMITAITTKATSTTAAG